MGPFLDKLGRTGKRTAYPLRTSYEHVLQMNPRVEKLNQHDLLLDESQTQQKRAEC